MPKVNLKKYYSELKDNWGGMDKEIIEVVVALNEAGFETMSSCSGHIDKVRPNPFVLIKTFPNVTEYGKKAKYKNETIIKLQKLLDGFYKNRKVDKELIIVIKKGNKLDSISISNGVNHWMRYSKQFASFYKDKKNENRQWLPNEKEVGIRKVSLPRLQKEMKEFARYLKNIN